MKLNIYKDIDDFEVNISSTIDTAVQLVKNYTGELDKCIYEVKEFLKADRDIRIDLLNYYITYIPVLLYEANTELQHLGIKTDAARMQRKEVFNTTYKNLSNGTVQAKTSEAQQSCQNEQFIEDVFTRIYKECEGKIEVATMLHSSLKKVQNWKTAELSITLGGK